MSIPHKKKGDPLKADEVNELAAFARAKSTIRGGNGIAVKNLPNGVYISTQQNDPILATIVCCGSCDQAEGCVSEGDGSSSSTCMPQNGDHDCCNGAGDCGVTSFDDERYWVVFGSIDPTAFCEGLTITDREPCSDVRWTKVVATNLAELNCHSHTLPPGTVVHLNWSYTTASPPQKVYWFTRTPMPKKVDIDECTDRQCCGSSSSSSSSKSSSSSGSSSSGSSSNSQSSQSQSASSNSQSNSESASQPSNSQPSESPSTSGSEKSTAIVPASWSPTGYTAMFISEAPEVRFDDVITVVVPQKNTTVSIDPKYLEVCEPDSVQVCGCVPDEPVAVGANVCGADVILKFARQKKAEVQVVIRLTGIRKGFSGLRFPDRTAKQFQQNERFINSAYDAE